MGLTAGFHEVEHTADWELEVWAPDLSGLLEQAALGMYALAGIRTISEGRRDITLSINAHDEEGLLVNFLSELLYLEEEQGLAFDDFDLSVGKPAPDDAYQLVAKLQGSRAVSREKDIKAVTYHKMSIEPGRRGLEVRIVFDV